MKSLKDTFVIRLIIVLFACITAQFQEPTLRAQEGTPKVTLMGI